MSALGPKPEKLRASICFPLRSEKQTLGRPTTTDLSQLVVEGVEGEHAEGPFRIGRIRRNASAVAGAILDAPLKGVSAEDKNAVVVVTLLVEPAVLRHNRKGPTAQAPVEVVDAGRH